MLTRRRLVIAGDKAQAYSKGGHTDFGSLTLLFSQHVAGLQIRTPEGQWKYVKPVEGGITCNAADTLTFLTNGRNIFPTFPDSMALQLIAASVKASSSRRSIGW